MVYRVKIAISIYTAYFDFNDINEAAAWMSTAVEKHSSDSDKDLRISMSVHKDGDED